MPTPARWQAAIIAAGFSVELYQDFDVESHTGFLPTPVNGQMSGFEYYAAPVNADVAHELRLVPENNFAVLFACGRRPLEHVSAFAAASVLASVSGGLLVDPQSDASIASSDAVAWAKMQIAQILG
ncbi:MAG: hypothetical protein V4858_06465 [Pseudomonadota bacterium]